VAVRADPVAPAGTPPPAADVVGDDATADTFRDRRRTRLSEGRRRRELLSTADPSADPQFINAIATADRFWGPDEKWRDALQSQRFDSASVEPTIGSVEAAEVAAVEPAPVTIVGRVGSLGGVLARVCHPRASRQSTADRIVDEEFNIPLPGRPLRAVGRARSWVTRLALIGAPLVLIGGVAYSCGVSTGSARLVQSSTIGADDASAFHLNSFPADHAAAFGVSYLSLCWTHPNAADTIATTDRLAALARMTSAGVTPGCGWAGSTPSKAPLAVTWDGTVKPIQGAYVDGAAAQLGFVVTMADGRTIGAALPIWVSSTTSMSAGVRVVGDIAMVPIAPAAAAPTPATPQLTDSTIADSLTRSVLVPFLRAWAVSDPVQLNLVLARDASTAARAGMEGQVSAPAVNRTLVAVNRGDPKGYRDGDQVTAGVGVDWTTRLGGVQRAAYSITLRMTAGRWQVTDITGTAPDPGGGAAPATTFANTTAASPAAG
jgi:hypothetical protein